MSKNDEDNSYGEPVLIIRPSTPQAYKNLSDWLARHPQYASIDILRRKHWVRSGNVLVGQPVHAVPWRRLVTVIRRYETIVVLCVGDDEVITGSTIHRMLGELLFSRRIVLIGPNAIQTWPGGYALFTLGRIREIVALAGACAVGLFTVMAILGAVLAEEAFMQLRRRR